MHCKFIVGTYESLIYLFGIIKINSSYELKKITSFKIHEGPIITATSFGPLLISATADNVKLSTIEKHQDMGIILQAQETSLTKCVLYRDEYLFISYEDGTISVLTTDDWESIKKLKAGKRVPVTDFAIHPSGRLAIAISRKSKEVSLYNLVESGKRISKLKLYLEPILIKFSPQGTKYAILFQSGLEHKIIVYSLGENPASDFEIISNSKLLTMEFISEDYLAVGECLETLFIYSLVDPNDKRFVKISKIKTIELIPVLSKDQKVVFITTSTDGYIRLWQMEPSQLPSLIHETKIEARITCSCVSVPLTTN